VAGVLRDRSRVAVESLPLGMESDTPLAPRMRDSDAMIVHGGAAD